MATRIQMRRGTTSEWNSADPTLNEGELGYNSTLGQLKVGDGDTPWSELDYIVSAGSLDTSLGSYIPDTEKSAINGVAELDASRNILAPASIIFEGTANDFETTLEITDPTADRTITLPNVTGTVITTGNLSDITNAGTFTGSIVIEGATADDHELTLSAGNPTADRTITFPDATGTVALTSDLSSYAPLNSPTFTGTVTLPNNTISQSMMGDDSVGTNEIGGLAVTEAKIADGAITNAKVSASAAIAQSKIADLTTDLAAKASLSGATFTGAVSGTSLTLSGDLTVNGTTTNINSTNLVVEDKNIVLGDTTTPTDTTADGGGLTLKGTTDHTFNWINATDAWTSSEHMDLASGKSYKINNTAISTALPALTWSDVKNGKSGLTIS